MKCKLENKTADLLCDKMSNECNDCQYMKYENGMLICVAEESGEENEN